MDQLDCRAPIVDHIPAIVALDQRCLGGLWSPEGYARELNSPNSVLRILTTPSADIVGLGCFWAITDEAHITLLGIDPAYQRQGLGRYLLWHLLQQARQFSLRHATLEVRCSNAIAQKLYAQFGFQALGRRRRYYADDEDALILWRSGLQDATFAQELQHWHATIQAGLQRQGWQISYRGSAHKPHPQGG